MASLSLGGKIINDLINLTKLHPQPTRLPADFHCVHWPGSFGLHWFLQILSNCYSRSQTAPIRIVLVHPTRSWSKSKTRGGQRHSWSVALRPHEQPMSLASPPTPPAPLPPFLLPALDGCGLTLKRVPYVSDKMGLYGAHLRFNEHVF